MGKVFDEIDSALEAFIRAQQMFFVATGPLSANGHINLSPKGPDTPLYSFQGHHAQLPDWASRKGP
jgi:hypothetical protein